MLSFLLIIVFLLVCFFEPIVATKMAPLSSNLLKQIAYCAFPIVKGILLCLIVTPKVKFKSGFMDDVLLLLVAFLGFARYYPSIVPEFLMSFLTGLNPDNILILLGVLLGRLIRFY